MTGCHDAVRSVVALIRASVERKTWLSGRLVSSRQRVHFFEPVCRGTLSEVALDHPETNKAQAEE